MANVYATFANQGEKAPAHLVAKAVDRDGNVVYKASDARPTGCSARASAADETYALQQPFAVRHRGRALAGPAGAG